MFAQVGPHFGEGHPALTWFPRYLLELARAWSPDPHRPLWLQEIGAPRSHVPDDRAADFVTSSLASVATTPSLEAVTWWCSHDVSDQLLDFPKLEYSLGLFTNDGKPKPEALAISDVLPDLHNAQPQEQADEPLEFSADWATGAGRSVSFPMGDLFARWVDEAIQTGRAPRLVFHPTHALTGREALAGALAR